MASDHSATLSAWCFGGLLVMGLIFVCIGIVLISFAYSGCKFFGIKGCWQNILAPISTVAMFLSLLFVMIDWNKALYLLIHGKDIMDSQYQWIITLDNIIYYLSTILLYIVLMMRIYIPFKYDKQHAMSKTQIIIVCCFIAIDILAICFFIISIYDAVSGNNTLTFIDVSSGMSFIISASVVVINDLIINAMLLIIMMTKLYKAVASLNMRYYALLNSDNESIEDLQSIVTKNNIQKAVSKNDRSRDCNLMVDGSVLSDSSISSSVKNELIRNKNEQKEIIHVMTKISLLTIICVVFAQGFTILALYTDYNLAFNKNMKDLWFHKHTILCWILRSIEGLTNCIVLYFTFVFNTTMYLKCCGLCHNCFEKCCFKCVVRRNIYNGRDKRDHNVLTSSTADDSTPRPPVLHVK